MILHTGGFAFGDISIKSRPLSAANSIASLIVRTPICSSSLTTLTSGAVICLFIFISLLIAYSFKIILIKKFYQTNEEIP
jgi:hypothetical protein|tara:strand:- start:44 stop:283 length:240 start_codon:yes stop_codon:yes gene_type:complete